MPQWTQIPNIFHVKALFSEELDTLSLISDIEHLILKEQLGNCCKPLAVYHVHLLQTLKKKLASETDLSNAELIHRFAAPFYSHERNATFKRPILSQAKRLGSAVGELYHVTQILHLLEANGSPCVAESAQTTTQYIQSLKEQVQSNFPTIVFFDADNEGRPVKLNSKREHAAVVVGHGVKAGRDYFVLAHWEQYHVVEAVELAESALQLQETRKPETFYKIHEDGNELWLTVDDLIHRKKIYKEFLKRYDKAIAEHSSRLTFSEEQLTIATENLRFVYYLSDEVKAQCESIQEKYPQLINDLKIHIMRLMNERAKFVVSLKEIPTNMADLIMKKADVADGGLRGVMIHTMPELEYEHAEIPLEDSDNVLTRMSLTRQQTLG